MKRWMGRILLCLILGAVSTVAVAWVCVWFAFRPGVSHGLINDYRWDAAGNLTEIVSFTKLEGAGLPFRAMRGDYPWPMEPIWFGLLFDTLLYALIWFGVLFGFTSAKRAIRRGRGRCPTCGYDLRGQRMKSRHPDPLPPPGLGEGARPGCAECGWGRAEEAS